MKRLEERLVRYARVDTQSDDSSATVPTTARQLDLQRVLQAELVKLGASDVRLNDAGFVLATIPGNIGKPVPTV
ncbi:MAG: peptidase T, partial [Candidatus Bipolaricaulota bacterium]|nr:peptidase T [Candidatus Bipolaricaulota bacterium]